MENKDFYAECAALLGSPHEGEPFRFHKRTRWNNRAPGQGRFPGRGIIRSFGSVVQVALHAPALKMIGTKEEVLETLRRLC